MDFTFVPATREKLKLKQVIMGPSGSGKSYTAMQIASKLAELEGGKIAVVDTEGGSMKKYVGPFQFDILELTDFNPEHYIKAIQSAEQAGYAVLVVDSFTHAWNGAGGVLEIADKSQKGNNKWSGWASARPAHNALMEAIINAKIHIIGTSRTKTVWEVVEVNGKKKPQKVGVGAVQSDEFEYEFDVVGLMYPDHSMEITKSRCVALPHQSYAMGQSEEIATILHGWLNEGDEPKHWSEYAHLKERAVKGETIARERHGDAMVADVLAEITPMTESVSLDAYGLEFKTVLQEKLDAVKDAESQADDTPVSYGKGPKKFGDGSEMTSTHQKEILKLAQARGYQGDDVNEYLMQQLGKRWWHFMDAQALLDAVSALAMVN